MTAPHTQCQPDIEQRLCFCCQEAYVTDDNEDDDCEFCRRTYSMPLEQEKSHG